MTPSHPCCPEAGRCRGNPTILDTAGVWVMCVDIFNFFQPDRRSNSTDEPSLIWHCVNALRRLPALSKALSNAARSVSRYILEHPSQHALDHHHIVGRDAGAGRRFKPMRERNDALDEALALPGQL